jgi:hypothetical protein
MKWRINAFNRRLKKNSIRRPFSELWRSGQKHGRHSHTQTSGVDMERQFEIIHWDGFHFGAVLTHWPQENTTAGTVWRFVMDRGQTLIAIPYQTPDKPAPANHCIPERIEPILAAGRFGFAVRDAAGVNINLEGHWGKEERDGKIYPTLNTWEVLINEATEKEFTSWKAEQDLPETAKYEKTRIEAHEKIDAAWKEVGLLQEDFENWQGEVQDWTAAREKISKPLLAPLGAIQESTGYKVELSQLNKKRVKIEAKHRKLIEKEKAAREKELIAGALEELRESLARHGATRRGDKWLLELFDFIRQDVCESRSMSPAIGAAGFARIVAKVEELTGKDITESLLMECEPWRLAKESGTESVERSRWVAVFPDGRQTVIEGLLTDIHNGRDVDLFEKVKPSYEERQVIEKQVAESQSRFDANPAGDIAGEGLYMTIREVKKMTKWSTETMDSLEEQDRLRPLKTGMAHGGKRRKQRTYFRADVERVIHEDRQKMKKV